MAKLIVKKKNLHLSILICGAIILVLLGIYSASINSDFKWDFFVLLAGLYGMFFFRKHINLSAFHYFLFLAFLVAHNLGVFRLYEKFPLGIEYDTWMHISFGIISYFILYHFLETRKSFSRNANILAAFLIMLGLSALHEIFEFIWGVALGIGDGILFVGAGDNRIWDTQKDMINNLEGGILGLGAYLSMIYIKSRLGGGMRAKRGNMKKI